MLGEISAYLGSPQSRKVTLVPRLNDRQFYQGNSRRFRNETCHGVIPCLMSQKLSSVLGEKRVYLGRPQGQKVTFGNSC